MPGSGRQPWPLKTYPTSGNHPRRKFLAQEVKNVCFVYFIVFVSWQKLDSGLPPKGVNFPGLSEIFQNAPPPIWSKLMQKRYVLKDCFHQK